MLRGWHLRSLELLEDLPLFVERLTWRACEHALSSLVLRPERNSAYDFAWNRVVTAGWNVAFTLEAYVLAGGYTDPRASPSCAPGSPPGPGPERLAAAPALGILLLALSGGGGS